MSGRRKGKRKRSVPSRDSSQARGSVKKKVVLGNETTVNNHDTGELENGGNRVTEAVVHMVPEAVQEVPHVNATPLEVPPVNTTPLEVPPVNTTPLEVPPVNTTPLEVPPVNATHLEVPPVNATPLEVPPVNATPLKVPPVNATPLEEESTKEVVYKAKLKRDTVYSDDMALKFNDVEYNSGGGYNKRSGIFTAPVSGTYLMWAQIMRTGDRHMGVYMYDSKHLLLRGFATAGSGIHGVASLSGEVYLTKGEIVWVAKNAGEKTRLKGKGFSSFGGTLLKAH